MPLRGWERCLFFVLCYLCSHTDSSSNHRGLLAPVNITTEVIGDKVKVYWKDHNQPELVSGAYAAVSEVDGDKLGSPVFIHAEDVKTKSITLSGLMPQMTYSIRVVLFLKDDYSVSSSPVTVTMNSYLPESDSQSITDSQVVIEVNRVTNHSAMLSWKFPVTHSTHGLHFKLDCNGQQSFTVNGRTVHKKYQTKSYVSDALSKYIQEQLIEDLVPNVNYTCELAAYNAASKKAFLMATAHFTTLVGKPRTPEKPRVDVNNDGIKVFLVPTADQFGPISHYMLIAVPVYKDKTQPITVAFTPLIPYNKVVGKAMPSHSASKSDKSVAFIIGTYTALPSEVVLGNTNEVLSAFKPNQFYVLVLAAFTKSKENPKSLVSLSSPSFPPFMISNYLLMYATRQAEERAVGEASHMVLWITVTIAFFGIAVIVSLLGVAYVLKKKGFKIPLKWGDKDNVGLIADTLVHGVEKTYVPMVKPVRSVHTDQSTRVASVAAKFDNPHFDVSVNRTKGLLEDMQVAMDSSEASGAAKNPPQPPTENSQSLPTTFTVKNEIPPARHNKRLGHSPFTYSTPGELEKLKTGTFSLPRSTGPIKTPRRKAATVIKSPVNNSNKGIPTPAPCKPTTVNYYYEEQPKMKASEDEESVMTAINDEEPSNTANDEESSMITNSEVVSNTTSNGEEPSTMAENGEGPSDTTNDERPSTTTNNEDESNTSNIDENQEPPMMAENEEGPSNTGNDDEEPSTEANNDEKPVTTANSDEEPSATASSNDEGPSMTANDAKEPSTMANNKEELSVTVDNDEDPLTTASNDDEPSSQ